MDKKKNSQTFSYKLVQISPIMILVNSGAFLSISSWFSELTELIFVMIPYISSTGYPPTTQGIMCHVQVANICMWRYVCVATSPKLWHCLCLASLSDPAVLCWGDKKGSVILLFYSHVSGEISGRLVCAPIMKSHQTCHRAVPPSIMPYCCLRILLCYLLPGCVALQ